MSTGPIPNLPGLRAVVLADPGQARPNDSSTLRSTPPVSGVGQTTNLTAAAPTAATTLPVTGVAAPTQAMLDTLLDHFNQQSPIPLRLVNAQAWPMALARQVLAGPATGADALSEKLGQWVPALQPWLAQQGTWQSRRGNQGFAATLYVPGPWLAQQGAQAALVSAQPTVRIVTDQAQALISGALALVLSTEEDKPLSALLTFEFGPERHHLPYGRDLFNPRQNAWLEQAVVLAHSAKSSDPASQKNTPPLCDEPQCPYHQRAVCPQPFCVSPLMVPGITPSP